MMKPGTSALAIATLLVGSPLVAAAATDATPEAKTEIERHQGPYPGAEFPTLKAIYRDHLEEANFEKSRIETDLRYGPDERHKLDVLMPATPLPRQMPVVIFFHGGGFVRGVRSDGAIYDNVLHYFTRHGMVGINATYRLAPENRFPAAAEDIRDVLRWTRKNIDRYGGDPEQIFLIGHSAGAVHVASYTFMEELHPSEGGDGLLGSILMSGVYGEENVTEGEHVYFGDDLASLPGRVPLAQVEGRRVPLFIIDAEHDPLLMQTSALTLTRAICERDNKCPRHQQIGGHNHFSMVFHINTFDDSIAGDILEFIDAQRNRLSSP